MQKIVEKDYDFSSIISDEINAKTQSITPKRHLISTDLSEPILKIVKAIKEDNIITELMETWGKEYFFKLMQICIKPQNDFEKVQEIIKMNISNKLTLEVTSKELGICKRTLNKIFSENDSTFKEYKRCTLHKKAEDMINQGYTIKEVSNKLEFSSLHYFKKFMNAEE